MGCGLRWAWTFGRVLINAPLDALGGARAAAVVSWTLQAGPGDFLDALGGARVAAGTGGMCRAAAGAIGWVLWAWTLGSGLVGPRR